MAKKEYKFNPHTLSYEKVDAPYSIRLYRILRRILIVFIAASFLNFIIAYFFVSPKIYGMINKKTELVMKYEVLNKRIEATKQKIASVKHRDNNIYRQLFAVDTLSIAGVYSDYPKAKYNSFSGETYEDIILDAWKHLDATTRLLYLESVSLDQLQVLTQNKDSMALAIPAIWPVNKKDLNHNRLSAFGMRFHPILKRYILHKGLDFSIPRGTPIYTTANGVVEKTVISRSGYGYYVLIDHGFGYKTMYTHLQEILVKEGQKVKRGETIAKSGNTGRSTGPHLHYEVRYKNTPVNPINYFRRDMSEEEFAIILEIANTEPHELLID